MVDFTGRRVSSNIEDRRGQTVEKEPTSADHNVNRTNKTDRLPVPSTSSAVPADTTATRNEAYNFKKDINDDAPFRLLAHRHEQAAVDHEMHAENTEATSNKKYKKEIFAHQTMAKIHGQASAYYNSAANNIKANDPHGARHMMTLGDHHADHARAMANKFGIENYLEPAKLSESRSLIEAIKNKEFEAAHQIIEAAFADVMAQKLVEMKKIIQARGAVTLEQVLRELNDPARVAFQALTEGFKEYKKHLTHVWQYHGGTGTDESLKWSHYDNFDSHEMALKYAKEKQDAHGTTFAVGHEYAPVLFASGKKIEHLKEAKEDKKKLNPMSEEQSDLVVSS